MSFTTNWIICNNRPTSRYIWGDNCGTCAKNFGLWPRPTNWQIEELSSPAWIVLTTFKHEQNIADILQMTLWKVSKMNILIFVLYIHIFFIFHTHQTLAVVCDLWAYLVVDNDMVLSTRKFKDVKQFWPFNREDVLLSRQLLSYLSSNIKIPFT